MTNPHEEHPFGPQLGDPLIGRRVGRGLGLRQGEMKEPIVENPNLPRMGDKPAPQRPVGGLVRLMDEHTARDVGIQGRGEMARVPDDLGPPHVGRGEFPPQQPLKQTIAAGEPGGYLRLQMRVDNGEVKVVGVSRVPGPLSPPAPMHGGLAYEVSLGKQQLGAGDVPDPAVRRGVVPLDAPERGHSIVEVPSFEFTVRVPADKVSTVNLPDLQVAVYRLDSSQVVHPTPERPLRDLVGHLAEEVATLRGIRTEHLPQDVRVGIERALR